MGRELHTFITSKLRDGSFFSFFERRNCTCNFTHLVYALEREREMRHASCIFVLTKGQEKDGCSDVKFWEIFYGKSDVTIMSLSNTTTTTVSIFLFSISL